jgi:hypothetical protein
MKSSRIALLALANCGVFAPATLGQEAPKQQSSKPSAPAVSAASPDWQGAWVPDFGALMRSKSNPVFTPEYEKQHAAFKAKAAAGHPVPNPMQNCLPPGMPDTMELPFPVEFLFTPGRVTIIQEAFGQVRRVYLDGRGHPTEPDPTFNGHSIGHWEGETLVIDTTQVRDDTYLPLRGDIDFVPGPHSDALHIVERIRLIEPDELEDKFTITDEKALAEPWEFSILYVRHRDWDLREYVCEENNRDQTDASGKDLLKGVQK